MVGSDALALKHGQRDYAVLSTARLAEDELAVLAVLPTVSRPAWRRSWRISLLRSKVTLHSVGIEMYDN